MTDTHEKFTPVAFRIVSDIPRKFGEDNRPFAVNVIARALAQAHQDGIREGKRQAAEMFKPVGERPCDCDRCYCHNVGDLQAVTAWDEQDSAYRAILSTIPDESE